MLISQLPTEFIFFPSKFCPNITNLLFIAGNTSII
jgi:hypothetical protein